MANKKTQKLFGVKVNKRTFCVIIRPADPNEEYSGEDTATSTEFQSVEQVDKYPELTVPFQIKKGQYYFLVYAVYDTGDSFSHHEGAVSLIDLFETRSKAVAAADAVTKHYSLTDAGIGYFTMQKERRKIAKMRGKNFSEFTVTYQNEIGNTVSCHADWVGYFERLTGCNVHAIIAV